MWLECLCVQVENTILCAHGDEKKEEEENEGDEVLLGEHLSFFVGMMGVGLVKGVAKGIGKGRLEDFGGDFIQSGGICIYMDRGGRRDGETGTGMGADSGMEHLDGGSGRWDSLWGGGSCIAGVTRDVRAG